MPESPAALHLAVALDGAGWHPAAWRAAGIRPAELFTAGYWAGLVQEAERGLLDFVTFEDGLGLQSDRYNAPDPRAGRTPLRPTGPDSQPAHLSRTRAANSAQSK